MSTGARAASRARFCLTTSPHRTLHRRHTPLSTVAAISCRCPPASNGTGASPTVSNLHGRQFTGSMVPLSRVIIHDRYKPIFWRGCRSGVRHARSRFVSGQLRHHGCDCCLHAASLLRRLSVVAWSGSRSVSWSSAPTLRTRSVLLAKAQSRSMLRAAAARRSSTRGGCVQDRRLLDVLGTLHRARLECIGVMAATRTQRRRCNMLAESLGPHSSSCARQ